MFFKGVDENVDSNGVESFRNLGKKKSKTIVKIIKTVYTRCKVERNCFTWIQVLLPYITPRYWFLEISWIVKALLPISVNNRAIYLEQTGTKKV